ncbi:MAG: hypothetical protein MJZ74_01005, partial [Muribaculaceae bacterium]|nr:hypothetical protein [Muribaculaceae bacterium]
AIMMGVAMASCHEDGNKDQQTVDQTAIEQTVDNNGGATIINDAQGGDSAEVKAEENKAAEVKAEGTDQAPAADEAATPASENTENSAK